MPAAPQLAPNAFKAALRAQRVQIGLWTALSSPWSTEILAGSGYDWMLLDMEHSPNDLRSMLGQLQAMAAYPTEPIVRLNGFTKEEVKLYLDLGVRSLLLPNVDTAEQARAIVQATRYPPRGVRGVSGLHRGNRWGREPGYHARADEELCLVVQVESPQAVANAAEIAAVEGIDALFVGPNDLAASMGQLMNPGHEAVQAAIAQVQRTLAAAGKAGGILARNAEEAKAYVERGYCMVGLGTDQGLLSRASDELAAGFRRFLAER